MKGSRKNYSQQGARTHKHLFTISQITKYSCVKKVSAQKKFACKKSVENLRNRKVGAGFTLVELMIVIAIIGVIATFAVPAFQGYVVTANSAKVNVHYEQAINWSKGEMLRLRAQLSSGFNRGEVSETRDTAQEWLNALQAEVVGTDSTSPEGSAAYSIDSETAGREASILFVLAGDVAAGNAVLTLTRPIYGEFTAIESTSVCWNSDDC
ncbi:MAG: prepilin-type N-terminal cleavage/methylation domain-containing protein [Candidatus Azotimanducaceae bacterium]|jgi:prepilin-type N-terminal cleavage/methylation domain-containing protein|tara:strand:- start:448 stop:1077 length:630 start_codon:yes stop_codon:yes gene_type:complete